MVVGEETDVLLKQFVVEPLQLLVLLLGALLLLYLHHLLARGTQRGVVEAHRLLLLRGGGGGACDLLGLGGRLLEGADDVLLLKGE